MTHVWLAEGSWCHDSWVVGVYTTAEEAKQGCARAKSNEDMTWAWGLYEDGDVVLPHKFIASEHDKFPFGKMFVIKRIELDKEIPDAD